MQVETRIQNPDKRLVFEHKTPDGGVLVGGYIKHYHIGQDHWLVGLDRDEQLQGQEMLVRVVNGKFAEALSLVSPNLAVLLDSLTQQVIEIAVIRFKELAFDSLVRRHQGFVTLG